MFKPIIRQRRAAHIAKTVVTTIGVFLACAGTALAQQPHQKTSAPASQLVSARLTDLEDAFWLCDYVATTGFAGNIVACTAVYDALKQRKFAGDFDQLLAWWQQNKAAQHQRAAQLALSVAQNIQKE